MAQKLRKLADEHAVWFWILCTLIYVVGYKVFNVTFLGKTPYEYDVTFLRLSLALLAIIMMKEIYKGSFSFHFCTKRMGKCFLLLWPTIPLFILNLAGVDITSRPVVLESLIMIVIYNMIVGFYEEVLMRGMLLGHMMRHWQGDKHRVQKAVLVSSLLFGAVHLGNLIGGHVIGTLFQVVYATAAGLMFAAAYLRTQSLWPCVIVHGLFDFTGSFTGIFYMPGEETPIPSTNLLVLAGIVVLQAVVPLYMLRKKKRDEIISLWDADCKSNSEVV